MKHPSGKKTYYITPFSQNSVSVVERKGKARGREGPETFNCLLPGSS